LCWQVFLRQAANRYPTNAAHLILRFSAVFSIFRCICTKLTLKTPTFAGIGAAKAAAHGMKVLRTGDFSPAGASM
ncbi:MAG: hypothetical protein RBS68_15240, partial [Anaerolineales bacterium]|nr:hypothetical protein [Anaerolineales bacterium]